MEFSRCTRFVDSFAGVGELGEWTTTQAPHQNNFFLHLGGFSLDQGYQPALNRYSSYFLHQFFRAAKRGHVKYMFYQ